MTERPLTHGEQKTRIREEARQEAQTMDIAAAAEGLSAGSGNLIRAMVEEDGLSPAAARKRILQAAEQVERMNKPTETRR